MPPEPRSGAPAAALRHRLARLVDRARRSAGVRLYGPGFFQRWAVSTGGVAPQRFGDNFARYVARGGVVRPEALWEAFTAGNEPNRGDTARFYFLCLLYDQVVKEELRGDVAELGVYKGNTAALLAAVARTLGTTAWLFDTFEGFDPADLSGVDADKRPEFSDTSIEAVRALVGPAHVRLVPGRFPETASAVPEDARFSVVHIDCDLYAPFRAALEFFYPRMVPGGFMVLHDYGSLHWDGTERAVDEFLADKPESVIPVPDGSGTAVLRRARGADPHLNWHAQARGFGFARQWFAASDPEFAPCLREGWSTPEDWGFWSVGPCSVLRLPLLAPVAQGLALEVDCSAALLGPRREQSVEVRLDGTPLATWRFTEAENRAVRLLPLPEAARGTVALELTLHPSDCATPAELVPGNPDQRPLGMALFRLRQRVGA